MFGDGATSVSKRLDPALLGGVDCDEVGAGAAPGCNAVFRSLLGPLVALPGAAASGVESAHVSRTLLQLGRSRSRAQMSPKYRPA